MYSIECIFIQNSDVDNVPENSKMRGKSSKVFYGNVIVMSHIKYLFVSVIS